VSDVDKQLLILATDIAQMEKTCFADTSDVLVKGQMLVKNDTNVLC